MDAPYRFYPEKQMSDVELYGLLVLLYTTILGRSEDEAWGLDDPEPALLDIATMNYAYWLKLPARTVHPSERRSIEERWNDGVNLAKRLFVQFYHRKRRLTQNYGTVEDARKIFNDMLVLKSGTQKMPDLATVNRQG